MSSIHRLEAGQEYSYEHDYTDEEKRQVTPAELVRWFNIRTFGVSDPPVVGTIRPLVRANTLAFWKKAISFFMPDRLHGWRSGTNDGNPTKSAKVNDYIRHIKRLETRKQGAQSQTRRPMQETEFRRLHEILKSQDVPNQQRHTSLIWKFGMPALINFQFHMIARIDDTTQVVLEHIRSHDNFDNALKTRLNWSKNVQDERDAPWQIVLASMNPVFCVYISLGLWLEFNLQSNPTAVASPYLFSFSDDITIPNGGRKAKETAQNIFGQRLFCREEFQRIGLLGSHSIRKFASTHVRRCGISKDDKDTRGRWKGKSRVSDRYDDVELPYPDAKVAEKLCIGGPCYYLIDNTLCADSCVLTTFILSRVVPNVRRRLPDSTAVVLGKAVLWLVFSGLANSFAFTDEYCNQVKADLVETGIIIADGQNPILRMPVLVSGDQGAVYIDELNSVAGERGAGEAQQQEDQQNLRVLDSNRTGGDQIRNWMLQLQSGLLSLRRENMELRNELGTLRLSLEQRLERGFDTVNGNVRRIGAQAASRRVQGAPTDTAGGATVLGAALAMTNPHTLMPNPKSLYDLWTEYLTGVGGRKPARLFSEAERGRVKYKYTRRKVIWDTIRHLVNLGHSSERAADLIYEVYGAQTSVTDIINRLRRDKKNGTLNPNLRM